jgi:cytochrome oxidase Cu insertion factor (SCO1/SenC/PrrC family)
MPPRRSSRPGAAVALLGYSVMPSLAYYFEEGPRFGPHVQKGGRMLNPGDKAPDFTGRDHTGKAVKLSDYKGKTVVLWFYPKADTPG